MGDDPFSEAQAFYQQGRFAEAGKACQTALAEQPAHPGALHMSGAVLLHAGRPKQALVPLKKAALLAPDSGSLFAHLGEALFQLGRWSDAAASLRTAVSLSPDHAGAHGLLGAALRHQGLLDEALVVFRATVALSPLSPPAWCNHGAALMEKGCWAEAVIVFRTALDLNDRDPDIHTNLGTALAAAGRVDEALAAFLEAIRLRPEHILAHNNLGNLHLACHRPDEASKAFRMALALDPERAELQSNLGNALRAGGRIDEAIGCYRKTLRKSKNHEVAASNLLLSLHYSQQYDGRAILEEHHIWQRSLAGRVRSFRDHANFPDPVRKLKIGFVSPDFCNHPVARFLLPLLESHDRSAVEVHVYSCGRLKDGWTGKLRSLADGWHDISGVPDDEAASAIREDRIDVLVDLALHSAGNRLRLFAIKPAPVQITWLAYAGTSGLEAMDYRLSDPYLDPPGGEGHYSEKTIRLPHTYWCYRSSVDLVPGPPPVSRNHFVTFGCFNSFWKVNDDVVRLWVALLTEVPDARLHLHAPEGLHRERLLNVLRSENVQQDRCTFFPQASTDAYFDQLRGIDIALDPFPFGGGTSTFDALWMGVPVVTLSGRTAVGRGATSILSNLGMGECIASTPADYVRTAARLAGNTIYLKRCRDELRERMKVSPLMDGPAFARAFEAACRSGWQTWCAAR